MSDAGPGHNSAVPRDQLKSIIERVENREQAKREVAEEIRDIYAEAKGNSYDVKALRTIVRMRAQDSEERREQASVLETYMHALGMI
jgi:uncharacterized protein (UPF0335 family)